MTSDLTPNFDHQLHTVFCRHQHGWFAAERLLEDMGRAATIRDIVSGQLEHVVRVVCWNAVEGIAHDVTDDIAAEIADMIDPNDMPSGSVIEFIQSAAGMEYTRGLRATDKSFAAE